MGTDSLREREKAEAIEWMNIMGVRADIIEEFKENDTVMVYYNRTLKYHPLDTEDERLVREYEVSRDALVYMIVRAYCDFGCSIDQLDSLLVVYKYEEEWEYERTLIRDGYVITYTINRTDPMLSDAGSIGYRTTIDGGIVRTS